MMIGVVVETCNIETAELNVRTRMENIETVVNLRLKFYLNPLPAHIPLEVYKFADQAAPLIIIWKLRHLKWWIWWKIATCGFNQVDVRRGPAAEIKKVISYIDRIS